MTEHYDVVLAGLVFAGGKRSAKSGVNSEDLEVFRRYLGAPQLYGFTGAGERRDTASKRGHVLEDIVLVLPIEVN